MDVRQLRYFIAIAEEENLTAAAKRLHMSQPPLSQQLAQMEEELGVPLLIRKGRRMELTEAGAELYRHALQIVRQMEESAVKVKEAGMGVRGRLRIGVNTLSVPELPGLLMDFQRAYPYVTYKIQQNETTHLCQLLRDRVIDLAFIRFPIDLSDFSVLHYQTDTFYYITSSEESRLHSEPVTLEAIRAQPLILPSTSGSGLFHYIMEQFAKQNITPNVRCECSDILLLGELVEAGFGSSIVPKSVFEYLQRNHIHAYEIMETDLTASYGIIWNKDAYLGKTAEQFIKMVSGMAQKGGPSSLTL